MNRRHFTFDRFILTILWAAAKLTFLVIWLPIKWLFFRKRLSADGYVLKKSESGRDELEHRVIAEMVLGRRLQPGEVVHHINGRRQDNRISNLCLMNRYQHDRYHDWYRWFRKTHGKYPRHKTQMRKLRESFHGLPLIDVISQKVG